MGFTGGQDKSCIGMHCLVVCGDCNRRTAYIHGRLYIYTLHCPLRDGPKHIGGVRLIGRGGLVMETYLKML